MFPYSEITGTPSNVSCPTSCHTAVQTNKVCVVASLACTLLSMLWCGQYFVVVLVLPPANVDLDQPPHVEAPYERPFLVSWFRTRLRSVEVFVRSTRFAANSASRGERHRCTDLYTRGLIEGDAATTLSLRHGIHPDAIYIFC